MSNKCRQTPTGVSVFGSTLLMVSRRRQRVYLLYLFVAKRKRKLAPLISDLMGFMAHALL
jgi:hypothetical protein